MYFPCSSQYYISLTTVDYFRRAAVSQYYTCWDLICYFTWKQVGPTPIPGSARYNREGRTRPVPASFCMARIIGALEMAAGSMFDTDTSVLVCLYLCRPMCLSLSLCLPVCLLVSVRLCVPLSAYLCLSVSVCLSPLGKS